MKIYKKVLSIVLCTVLLTYCPLLKYTYVVSYADSITAQNPLLMPLTGWLTAVAIGSGIIGKSAADASNQLIQNVSNNLKQKEMEKINNDETYNTPFRVINGGKPEKPNNNNKNGSWFALGAAAAGGSAMLFEKGAAEMAMESFNEVKAYQKLISEMGVQDASSLISSSNASNVAMQLADISNSAVTQFDRFLHSDFWSNNNLDYDDCLFNVSVRFNPDLTSADAKYPLLIINVFKKPQNLTKIRITGSPFKYRVYNGTNFSYSGYYVDNSNNYVTFLNDDNVAVYSNYYRIQVNARSAPQDGEDDNFKYSVRNNTSSNSSFIVFPIANDPFFYFGYKWAFENPWSLTNNVYNVNQTFDVNFPNWEQGIMEILGQQLSGIKINVPEIQPTWEPTQTQVQTGTTPQNVIVQYINNYENPESIPDDQLNPDPEPDPDPEPAPEPTPEPVPDDNFLNGFMLPTAITNKFPFCIPFDVAKALRLFSTSQREAPRWECDLHYGNSVYHLVIDLSQFNDVATFVRQLEFILFVVGLAVGTRNLIRG